MDKVDVVVLEPNAADETIERILHADPLRHWWHGGYPG